MNPIHEPLRTHLSFPNNEREKDKALKVACLIIASGAVVYTIAYFPGIFTGARQLITNVRLFTHSKLKGPDPFLLQAVTEGKLEDVEYILENNADINARDSLGRTPLLIAIENGHHHIIEILIKGNANMEIRTEKGETVLHLCTHLSVAKRLLSFSICRNMINETDKEGETPLHKAVSGTPKSGLVQLLLDRGADFQKQNKEGNTPLHLAIKHGHKKSAEVLIQCGFSTIVLNQDDETPFDLACQFDRDETLRLFLGSEKKVDIDRNDLKDQMKFYQDCMDLAWDDRNTQETIFYLLKLSHLSSNHHIIAAQLLNCCIYLSVFLLPQNRPVVQTFFFLQLERIEKLFLKKKGFIAPKLDIHHLQKNHKKLDAMIESSSINISIENTLVDLTIKLRSFLKDLIEESILILGPPKIKWSCIAMGSIARSEMFPYSDLEFAFLIEHDEPEAHAYFLTLSELLELKIIKLGTTKFSILNSETLHKKPEKRFSPIPSGFSLDSGGNTPITRHELIGTPKKLAQLLNTNHIIDEIILANVMSGVCWVAGNECLVTQYNQEKNKVLCLNERNPKSRQNQSPFLIKEGTNREKLALCLLGGGLTEYRIALSKKEKQIEDLSFGIEPGFGIKKELIRPFQEIINSLAIFFGLAETNSFEKIRRLAQLGVFSKEGAAQLERALSLAFMMRWEAHHFYKEEKDIIARPEPGIHKDETLLTLSKKNIEDLAEIYRILVPFHKCCNDFYETRDIKALNQNAFYNPHFTDEGNDFDTLNFLKEAKEQYEQAISINPFDVPSRIILSNLELELGNYEDTLIDLQKALQAVQKELIDSKKRRDHPITLKALVRMAIIFQNLARVQLSLGKYREALDHLLLALETWKYFPDSDQLIQTAECLARIGEVYAHLGMYTEADHALTTALENGNKIHQEAVRNCEAIVSDVSVTMGSIYAIKASVCCILSSQDLMKQIIQEIDYNQLQMEALHYYLKALDLKKKCEGESTEIACLYNDIGVCYGNLKKWDVALLYQEQALEIYKKRYNQNPHFPLIGFAYINLGVACAECDDQRALMYLKRGLAIFKSKENLNLATDAVGRALMHKAHILSKKGDYKKAAVTYKNALLFYANRESFEVDKIVATTASIVKSVQ